MGHSFITWTLFCKLTYIFLYILKGMVKCDFWELEYTQKLLWFKFEKCLNVEKLLSCCFYQGWSTDPNDLNPTGLDSAFPDLSNKIDFIQFGSLNRVGLIFETRYRTMFEWKWKNPNSNEWAAREEKMARPAMHSAYTGWLSWCPLASVRRGCETVRGNVVRWI